MQLYSICLIQNSYLYTSVIPLLNIGFNPLKAGILSDQKNNVIKTKNNQKIM